MPAMADPFEPRGDFLPKAILLANRECLVTRSQSNPGMISLVWAAGDKVLHSRFSSIDTYRQFIRDVQSGAKDLDASGLEHWELGVS